MTNSLHPDSIDSTQQAANMLYDMLDSMHNSTKILMRITLFFMVWTIIKIKLLNGIEVKSNEIYFQLITNMVKTNNIESISIPSLILFVIPIIYKIITQIPIITKHYITLATIGDLTFANKLINSIKRYNSIIKYFILINILVIVGSTLYLLNSSVTVIIISILVSLIFFWFLLFSRRLSANDELDLMIHLAQKIIKYSNSKQISKQKP